MGEGGRGEGFRRIAVKGIEGREYEGVMAVNRYGPRMVSVEALGR